MHKEVGSPACREHVTDESPGLADGEFVLRCIIDKCIAAFIKLDVATAVGYCERSVEGLESASAVYGPVGSETDLALSADLAGG